MNQKEFDAELVKLREQLQDVANAFYEKPAPKVGPEIAFYIGALYGSLVQEQKFNETMQDIGGNGD